MHRLPLLLLCWMLATAGASYDFERSDGDDEIDFGGSVIGNDNNVFSITGWYNQDSGDTTTAELTLYGEGNSGDNTPVYSMSYNRGIAGQIRCFLRDDSGNLADMETDVNGNDGLWHHTACVSRADDSAEHYFDGASVDTNVVDRNDGPTLNTAHIGALERMSIINFADNARIAHVAIWNSTALSTAQINELASGVNPQCLSTLPDRYWPLWDATPVADLSGNGDTGTVTGATLDVDGPPILATCGGQI